MPSQTGTRPHVLIVEQNPTGHRLFYARLLAQAAREADCDVTLVLSSQKDETSEAVHLGGLDDGVRLLRKETLSVSGVEELSRELGVARTVIPDGDRFAISLATHASWRGAGRVSVLVMREDAQPGSSALRTRIKSSVRTLAFRRAAAMSGVDLRVLKSAGWSGRSRFPVAVDPVSVLATASDGDGFRREHGIDDDRFWFAVLGAISERKNLGLVMRALAGVGVPVGLLVAGQLDTDVTDDVRDHLRAMQEAGDAVVIDRLLTDRELDAAVVAADCLVLAHSNEGPSGLLGKAAAVGTRIVAAGATSLRRDLEALDGIGEWSELDLAALTAALRRASSSARPVPVLSPSSARFTAALL